jgi:hypothetical protein
MRWLFVSGVSIDLAGALVIAGAVLSRTPAENREEATSRYDGNLWVIIMREREQSQVRIGVYLLGAGFVLQLAAYLWSFGDVSVIGGIALALGLLAGGFFAGRRLAAAAVPLRYHSVLDLPPGIEDERHGHRLADLAEVKTWRRLHGKHLAGRDPVRVNEPILEPRVNHGRWVVECPRCRGSVMLATPGLDTVVCSGNCGLEYPVAFPGEREQIERVLLLRPRENRNWSAGETIDALRSENVAHGFPVPE